MRRTDRYRYPIIMMLLILLQFTVRSRLGGDRILFRGLFHGGASFLSAGATT